MGQRVITNNTLFYGDNLPIMREYLADETIDLVYLDPPFNSSRNYNVLYKDESGIEAEAQIVAFEDTWHWSRSTEEQYRALVAMGDQLARLLEALVAVVGRNQMMAYLVMMAVRLLELHRVLKPTGSLYLHCDPTASHYLKLILDMIFGAKNFVNEIIWKRTNVHSHATQGTKHFSRINDTVLFYGKSDKHLWNQLYIPHSDQHISNSYRYVEEETGRKYALSDLTVTDGKAKGNPTFEFLGVTRYWRYNKDKMEQLLKEGRIVQKSPGTVPRYKRYLDESLGTEIGSLWADITPIAAQAQERLGYPTQKPLALLERIIQASSNPGDVVLDPFCGCGTAVHAAQKLGRIWAGIDITPLATTIIKSRLQDAFAIEAKKDYEIVGEPTTLSDAKHLANQDRYQFQWWALGLLPARPFGGQGGSKKGKKGADKGIDGIMTFQDTPDGTDKRIIIQVKSGKVKSSDIRDLNGTVEREKNAVIGIFITLEEPSKNMEIEALEIGYYHSDSFNSDYPKIQILTIEQLLAGAKAKFPGKETTLKQAPRESLSNGEQEQLI